METAVTSNETNVTLLDGLIRIGADNTTRDCAQNPIAEPRVLTKYSIRIRSLILIPRRKHTHRSIPSSSGSVIVIGKQLGI